MNADFEHIAIKNNENEQRYEAQVDGYTAVLEYERAGGTITFIHTGVPQEIEHHGIANKLARTALNDARAEHLTVIAQCPFVASYIREHTDYLSLLSKREQERIMHE